jgi:hypothetical protein
MANRKFKTGDRVTASLYVTERFDMACQPGTIVMMFPEYTGKDGHCDCLIQYDDGTSMRWSTAWLVMCNGLDRVIDQFRLKPDQGH